MISSELKQELFVKYGKDAANTGSTEGQVALFTFRIQHITAHLKGNHKDKASERSLIKLVGKRKKLLNYLKNKDIEKYRALIAELNIRK